MFSQLENVNNFHDHAVLYLYNGTPFERSTALERPLDYVKP